MGVKIVKLILVGFFMTATLAIGSEDDPQKGSSLTGSHFALNNDAAIRLVKQKTISRRAESYSISKRSVPIIAFKDISDDEAEKRLISESSTLLGDKAARANVVDNGSTLGLKLEKGMAWIAKRTGALTIKTHDGVRGITEVKNAQEAVNIALAQIEKTHLIDLSEYESLDVISVTATYHAGWKESDGKIEPVYFDPGDNKDPVAQFKSDYTVYFGRRYRGVPIIGPTLGVRLDATGRMVAFMKNWRDIAGETGEHLDILTQKDIDENRNTKLSKELYVKCLRCGYVEDTGVGYLQEYPGVGCNYVYYDKDEENALNSEVSEWVNASVDDSFELSGKKLSYESGITKRVKTDRGDRD
jgi:hypothetical protein